MDGARSNGRMPGIHADVRRPRRLPDDLHGRRSGGDRSLAAAASLLADQALALRHCPTDGLEFCGRVGRVRSWGGIAPILRTGQMVLTAMQIADLGSMSALLCCFRMTERLTAMSGMRRAAARPHWGRLGTDGFLAPESHNGHSTSGHALCTAATTPIGRRLRLGGGQFESRFGAPFYQTRFGLFATSQCWSMNPPLRFGSASRPASRRPCRSRSPKRLRLAVQVRPFGGREGDQRLGRGQQVVELLRLSGPECFVVRLGDQHRAGDLPGDVRRGCSPSSP